MGSSPTLGTSLFSISYRVYETWHGENRTELLSVATFEFFQQIIGGSHISLSRHHVTRARKSALNNKTNLIWY